MQQAGGGCDCFPVLSSPQQDSPWGRCAGAEVLGGFAAGASRGVCGPGCFAACAMKAGGAALRCGRGVGVIAAEACSRSRASGLRRAFFFWAMAMGVGVGWRFQGFLGGGFLGAWARHSCGRVAEGWGAGAGCLTRFPSTRLACTPIRSLLVGGSASRCVYGPALYTHGGWAGVQGYTHTRLGVGWLLRWMTTRALLWMVVEC